MRHLFILNPIAGGKKTDHVEVFSRIERAMRDYGEDYEIYITKAPMDAAEKVKREAIKGDELRVYACGGDGTLSECVHGASGYSNAAVTHYPCGTGNDFIKTFSGDTDKFFDIFALLHGDVHPMDVIDVNGRRCINICSVGIDARVATDVHKYSGLPVIGGSSAYVVSAVINLFKGINSELKITADGQVFEGKHALVCACNGRYYGGGFNPIATALPDDGLMEMLIVKGVSIVNAALLIGKYASGKYYEMPDRITHISGKKIEIVSKEPIVINADGEVIYSDHIVMSIIPAGVNFILPHGFTYGYLPEKKIEVNA